LLRPIYHDQFWTLLTRFVMAGVPPYLTRLLPPKTELIIKNNTTSDLLGSVLREMSDLSSPSSSHGLGRLRGGREMFWFGRRSLKNGKKRA
jgi:hypothetical protein